MTTPLHQRASYADLLALPEGTRAEVIAGELIVQPAPLPRHSKSQRALGRFIGGPYDDDDGHGGPGGWWIFIEVDVQLGLEHIVRPDLPGWRRERLPAPGDVRPIAVVPDWICEIQSPSTAGTDRVVKRNLYARHSVKHYWLLDPDLRTLEALELDGGRWVETGVWDAAARVRIPPFAEVELEIGRLFLPEPERS